MKDEDKTREQLVAELAELRQRIAELEASGAEHKRVEERLRFQANALDQIGDAVIAIDDEQRITYLNRAAAEQYDVSPDDALGCKLTELYQYRWLKPEHEQAAYASLAEKGYCSGENIHIKRNGDRILVESTVSVIQDDSGQDIGMLAVMRDITERKRVEEERERLLIEHRTQRVFLERLIEAAPVGIAVVRGPDHRYEMVNPYYQAIPGVPDVPMVGRTIAEVFPAVAAQGAVELVETVYRTGQTTSLREYKASVGPEREQTYWNVDHVPLHGPDGDVDGVLILANEITEQVLARKQVEELAARDEAILTSITEGLTLFDLQGNVVDMNPAALRIHGFEQVKEAQRHLKEFPDTFELRYLDGRLMPVEEWPLARVLQGETFSGCEAQVRRLDTGDVWIGSYSGTTVCDKAGNAILGILTLRDVTAEKKVWAERERLLAQVEQDRESIGELARILEQERDVLQTTMESTQAQLAYLDPHFNFVRVNSAYARGSGYSKEELIGRNHFELFPQAENQAIFERVRDTGEPVLFHAKPFEYPERPELGITYWDWTLVPVKDEDGDVRGLVLSLLDVTEREQTMVQLDAEQARLKAIIENAPEGIVVTDKECRIVLANPVAERLYARSIPYGEGLQSYSEMGLCHPDGTPYDPRDLPLARSALDGEVANNLEMAILWPDGQQRDLLASSAPIRHNQGKVNGAVGVFQDITERRQIERVLQRRNRDLGLLNRLGQELGATLDLPQVLEQVLRAVREVVAAAGSLVWLWDEEDPDWIVCRAAFHPDLARSPLNLRLRSGEGIIGWVAQHGKSAIVSRAQEDPRFSRVIDAHTGFQTHSILAVPLQVRDTVIGVLEVVNKSEGEFSVHDRLLIETLAASVAIAIENARLYDQAKQTAAAAERSHLARELHDAVSQTLFSASVIAESLPRLWERNPDKVQRGLEQLQQLTRGALAEMRTLLLELRPTALVEAELGDLLRQLTEAFASRTPVKVSLTVEGQRSLPPEVQIALYRITQEALNNVTKHARATQVTVSLRRQPKEVELRIQDDGRGFDPGRVQPGRLGLNILRERAEAIGATLQITSQADQGTEIAVIWSDPQRERKVND